MILGINRLRNIKVSDLFLKPRYVMQTISDALKEHDETVQRYINEIVKMQEHQLKRPNAKLYSIK